MLYQSSFSYIIFTVTEVKKIICYTGDFVTSRFHCISIIQINYLSHKSLYIEQVIIDGLIIQHREKNIPEICDAECASVISRHNFTKNQDKNILLLRKGGRRKRKRKGWEAKREFVDVGEEEDIEEEEERVEEVKEEKEGEAG